MTGRPEPPPALVEKIAQAEQDWLAAEVEFLRVAPERRRWVDSIEVRAYWKYLERTQQPAPYPSLVRQLAARLLVMPDITTLDATTIRAIDELAGRHPVRSSDEAALEEWAAALSRDLAQTTD